MNSRFIGRYKIERELGRGGMAVVYLARDPAIDRQVAIKLLPSQYTADPHFLARFRREAEIVANLEHPGIVPVYDFDEHDDQPFIVMRYMAGGSLARRLSRGAIPVAESARIFERLAPALDSAHAKGFIHRDLKPANILFDQYDEPYLADFGIVKLMESSETALTAAGGIVGTPAYMSPEQVSGKGELDGHSDIYALGAILFEMLTGRQPYEADTPMGLALKHIREPVPRILDVSANVPAGSQAVVNKAMAKEPDDRYATAGDLSAAINTLASRGPMTAGETTATSMATQIDVAHPATPGDRLVAGAGRWKRPWLFVLAAVGLFICIAVVASVFFFRGLRNGVRAGG